MAVGLTSLLKTVVDNKASGLHLRGNSFAFVRLNGQVKQIENSFMSNDEVKKIADACMGSREKKHFEEKGNVDFALDAKEHGRFRFNVFRQSGKTCMAIRHIPLQVPSFETLNLPGETLKKIADSRRGLIIVNGMTGSGKSSTLAAMISHINKTRRSHIITIEDPIEFVFPEEKCLVSQLALEIDTPSYLDALRGCMREDPDVIMIGEMRDSAVMRAAIQAAETGQLVFSTVHTTNAVQTITRIIEAFPSEQQGQVRLQLSEFLRGIVSQRLMPCVQGGMIPAVEILTDSPQIKKLISDNKIGDIQKFINEGEFYGMRSFDQALVELYKNNKITIETALAAATSADAVMLAIRGITGDRNAM